MFEKYNENNFFPKRHVRFYVYFMLKFKNTVIGVWSLKTLKNNQIVKLVGRIAA